MGKEEDSTQGDVVGAGTTSPLSARPQIAPPLGWRTESSRSALGQLWGSELEMPPSLQCPAPPTQHPLTCLDGPVLSCVDDVSVPRDGSGEQQSWPCGEQGLLLEGKRELRESKRGRHRQPDKTESGKEHHPGNLYLRSPLSQALDT